MNHQLAEFKKASFQLGNADKRFSLYLILGVVVFLSLGAISWILNVSWRDSINRKKAGAGISRIVYHGWADSYRLSNGEVDLVVVPAIGRIMRYGYVDEPNLLWENYHLFGHTENTDKWSNYGGDKIWPWPIRNWPHLSPILFRPPSEWDGSPHRLKITGLLSVRMVSPVMSERGVRVVRDISLSRTGSQISIKTYFEISGAATSHPMSPWSITQLHEPEFILATTSGNGDSNYRMICGQWTNFEKPQANILIARSPLEFGKIGVDSPALAWYRKGHLLIQKMTSPTRKESGWTPFTQAQIYWDRFPQLTVNLSPYVELEFAPPPVSLLQNIERSSTTVTWELHRFSSTEPRVDEIIQKFNSCAQEK